MIKKFDPELKYNFTRSVKWNGKELPAGEPIPDDGTGNHVLEALYRQGVIQPVEQTPVEQTPVEQTAATAEIKHEGAGWYNVYVSGMQMNEKKLRKDDAEKWCEEKGLTYNIS